MSHNSIGEPSRKTAFRDLPSGLTDALLEFAVPAQHWYERVRGTSTAVGLWLITRGFLVGVLVFIGNERRTVWDVRYYAHAIAGVYGADFSKVMFEYPVPAVWILWFPHALSGGSEQYYIICFVAMMIACDAIFSVALWRGGRKYSNAFEFWILFVVALGPLAFVRFDIVPSLLAGVALLAMRNRPRLASGLIAVGAAVKLWPALLQPGLSAKRSTRFSATACFAAVGGGLALASFVSTDFARLISPLKWQSGRGLQIESVLATPVMLGRMLQPDKWIVAVSKFQAYEISGPGVNLMITLGTLMLPLGLILIGVIAMRAFRNGSPAPTAVATFFQSVVLIMIITNKTLSPQYILWLGGTMAALIVLGLALPVPERKLINRMALQLIGVAVMTHLLFPILYDRLLGHYGPRQIIPATLMMTLRNVALILMTVDTCRTAWYWLGRPPVAFPIIPA